MTDLDALYRAICAQPDEDTPRLAYADALEESGDADRAEFIRIQVERERCGDALYGADVTSRLLNLHAAAWSRLPCPGCAGKGHTKPETWSYVAHWDHCTVCNVTGDLFTGRPVTFRRGFVDSVECTLAELGGERRVVCKKCYGEGDVRFTCEGCDGSGYTREFAPSPWAAAVVAAVPVTRCVDRTWTPTRVGDAGYAITSVNNGRRLPRVLADKLYRGHVPIVHPTAEAATDALARAAAQVVRSVIVSMKR